MAAAPEPERWPCARPPLVLCLHQLSCPIWTRTPLCRFSVAQVRLLLQVALPQPVLDLPTVMALIAYQQRHNYAAYCSHRKRLLAQLHELRW